MALTVDSCWNISGTLSIGAMGQDYLQTEYRSRIVTIPELLEKLIDDPFDDELRSKLASQYVRAHQWEKAHKQFALIKKQRELSPDELMQFAGCLRELGFGEEADLISDTPKVALEPMEKRPAAVESPSGVSIAPPSSSDAKVIPIHTKRHDRIRFSDIGGLDQVKKTIRMQIIEPFMNPEMFAKFGKKAGGGVLLYGAPGCGKTMIARAVASECNAEFFPVAISDILGIYHGESEQNLSAIFEKARANKPCVLFFDELDALAYARSKISSMPGRTLVNEFLNQLDGVGRHNDDILFLAASNMPWDVDAAMKRPGRFSRQIFVPPPDHEARVRILQIRLRHLPVEAMDEDALANRLKHFSGADIDGLIEKAKEAVIEKVIETGIERNIALADFERALATTIPSTEEWLRTAKNLVKFSGADRSYQEVEIYLKKNGLL
jgi:SpoVK/Ycf46/Vps4 family AAA+-type ATPase